MKTIHFIKKYWNYFLSIFFISLITPLLKENFFKAVILILVVIIWNIIGIITKNFLKASIFTLLLSLPFNITYQLPYSILGIEIANPFVDGVIVNYLIPTISILDVSVFLILLSLLSKRKIQLHRKGLSFIKIFILFSLYLLFLSVFKESYLSILNSLRLLLYVFTFYFIQRDLKNLFDRKFSRFILIESISLVILQGLISLQHFNGGTSLGLSYLGESQVVSGMMGSSFLNLNGALYLRGYGTFPHPNVLGGWLILNILIGWHIFDRISEKKYFPIILMLVSSLVLLLTFSRISFVVCLLIWVFFIFKNIISSRKKNRNFAFVGLISERVLNLFTGGDTSLNDRLGLIKSSLYIIKRDILTGVGLGRFVANMDDTVPRSGNGILLLQPVHNIFLLIISEIGVIGTLLFGSIIHLFFKEKKWELRAVIGLLVIFIIGMFDHYLFSLPQGLVILFMLIIL